MTILDWLEVFKETLAVILGGLVGFLASFLLWKKTDEKAQRQQRAEHIRTMVSLGLNSLTYFRSLIYAKPQGLEFVGALGQDPVKELMAYAMCHVHEAGPVVQKMHLLIEEVHSVDMEEAGADTFVLSSKDKFASLVNDLNERLEKVMNSEKLGTTAPKWVAEEIAELHKGLSKRLPPV